jgi:hypothetical protein
LLTLHLTQIIADVAVPIGIVSKIIVGADSNIYARNVTQVVKLIRPSQLQETPGNRANTLGYNLFVGPIGSLTSSRFTLVANMTITALGGSAGGVVDNGFQVSNLVLGSSNYVYMVQAWNQYGTAIFVPYAYTTNVTYDIATPIAVASNLICSTDTSPLIYQVSTVVTFVRDSFEREYPELGHSVDSIQGYALLHLYGNGTRKAKLAFLPAIDLAGHSGGQVTSGLQVNSLSIQSGDQFQVLAYNANGLAQVGATISIDDGVLPLAKAASVYQSVDLNADLGYVTSGIYFVRANSSMESPTDAPLVLGYAIFLISTGALDLYVQNSTLASLGGSSGMNVSNPISLTDLCVQKGDYLLIVSYNADGFAASGISILIDDRSRPSAQAGPAICSTDLNLWLNNVTFEVKFIRAASRYEYPGDSRQLEGYVLYLGTLYDHKLQMLSRMNLSSLGGSSGNIVDHGFQVQNAEIPDPVNNYLIIFSWNSAGEDFAPSILTLVPDAAKPIAVATNLYSDQDSNLLLNYVAHVVHFTRDLSANEAPGTSQNIDGYQLYIAHTSESEQWIATLTLADLNQYGASFSLSSQHVNKGDQYKIYSYNEYGLSYTSSSSVSVGDKASPIAVAGLPVQSDDTNISENIVSQVVQFTRPSSSIEYPGDVNNVTGYCLFLANSTLSIKSQIINKTVAELGGSSGAFTSTGFVVSAIAIQTGDYYVIIPYNQDGNGLTAAYVYLKILDYAAPLAVATGLYITNDTSMNALTVTHNISFVRGYSSMEQRGSSATTVAYGLYLTSNSGVIRVLVQVCSPKQREDRLKFSCLIASNHFLFQNQTLSQLGGAAGQRVNFPFVVVNQTVIAGDVYQVFSLSMDTRASATSGALVRCLTPSSSYSTIDEAVPVVTATTVSTTIDTNMLVNVVTHNVTFIRPSNEVW